MSYDTLALTMQMRCPLEGIALEDGERRDKGRWKIRHRIDADGIHGSNPSAGEITAACGVPAYIRLDDHGPDGVPSHQWAKLWDADDRTDRGPHTIGQVPCPECMPDPEPEWVDLVIDVDGMVTAHSANGRAIMRGMRP